MRRDNPNDSELVDIKRRIRELETQSPVGSTSVTRGALRVASNEGLLVEGSAKVSGWLVVTGTLKGTGTFDWSGDMILSGSQHVTGPTVFDGALTVNGTWALNGNGTVAGNVVITGNVDVNNPGRIRITGGVSPATLQDGALTFGTGGQVVADTGIGGVRLQAGGGVVNVGSVASMRHSGSSVIVGPLGITINSAGGGTIDMVGTVYLDRFTIPTVSGMGLPANVLIINGDGSLSRTV